MGFSVSITASDDHENKLNRDKTIIVPHSVPQSLRFCLFKNRAVFPPPPPFKAVRFRPSVKGQTRSRARLRRARFSSSREDRKGNDLVSRSPTWKKKKITFGIIGKLVSSSVMTAGRNTLTSFLELANGEKLEADKSRRRGASSAKEVHSGFWRFAGMRHVTCSAPLQERCRCGKKRCGKRRNECK